MSDLELHKYLPKLPEAALQEFTEWCVLEQSKAAGIEFTPNKTKLENLIPNEYIWQLIDQFMKEKPDPIKTGLVATMAGQEADSHGLIGSAIMADFIALYVKYLIPANGTTPEEAKQLITEAAIQQYEKLSELADKYNVTF
ncbi:hypothetical protein BCD64_23105 [Nostoc sp. MBR 210]|uniref:Uncharacterized protein n=1 Tax=Nostoc spongiaeforme FACHB-130 TaxID=1357510 RepID=A0ABR8FV15_9NOSO|nr:MULTISPECIES: hypothetical protein [Nostoc]MBD2494046.1 hypothetical protein [Nostoc sp. FACHB-280]MBD2594947.1 hypothetical protein [Nostoc spongiaeforme FACHB-130]OCQ98930.1 hypothetical protein BCD64_23105 [Nostoc sp. MBR 210]